MSEKNQTVSSEELPDRLSVDPQSPYYNEAILTRDVGIRFKGVEKTNVEEYCVSEGWIRVTAGNAKDRHGNPRDLLFPSIPLDKWSQFSGAGLPSRPNVPPRGARGPLPGAEPSDHAG